MGGADDQKVLPFPPVSRYNGVVPICKNCGENNPDDVTRCNKCGVSFWHQNQARADVKRGQMQMATKTVTWIAAIVILIIAAPFIYRFGMTAYLGQVLKSVTRHANSECNGPITADTPSYNRDKIAKCLASDEDLAKAKEAFTKFTGEKLE